MHSKLGLRWPDLAVLERQPAKNLEGQQARVLAAKHFYALPCNRSHFTDAASLYQIRYWNDDVYKGIMNHIGLRVAIPAETIITPLQARLVHEMKVWAVQGMRGRFVPSRLIGFRSILL